jgi:hypothetical protein
VCGVAAAYNNKKIQGRGVRPRFSFFPLKNKNFLGKKSSAAAPDTS